MRHTYVLFDDGCKQLEMSSLSRKYKIIGLTSLCCGQCVRTKVWRKWDLFQLRRWRVDSTSSEKQDCFGNVAHNRSVLMAGNSLVVRSSCVLYCLVCHACCAQYWLTHEWTIAKTNVWELLTQNIENKALEQSTWKALLLKLLRSFGELLFWFAFSPTVRISHTAPRNASCRGSNQ